MTLLFDYQRGIELQGYTPFIYNYQNNFDKNYQFINYGNEKRFDDFNLELIENNEQNFKTVSEIIKDEEFFLTVNEIEPLLKNKILYYFYKDKEIYGIGVYQESRISNDYVSIGMLIKKEFRRIGLGTLLLLKLQQLAIKNNKVLCMSGCSARNPNSRKTIEKSSGILRGKVIIVTL